MDANTGTETVDLSQQAVGCETFTAMVITSDRASVLLELTHQAVEHFGRDQLYVRGVDVAVADGGVSYLASAHFTTASPRADIV